MIHKLESNMLEKVMKEYKEGTCSLDDVLGVMCLCDFLVPLAVYSNNKLLNIRNRPLNLIKNNKEIKISNLIQKDITGKSFIVLYTSHAKYKSLPKGYDIYEMSLEDVIDEYKNSKNDGIVINPNTDSFSFVDKQIEFLDLCVRELKKMI